MATRKNYALTDFFEEIPDRRKPGRNFRHPLVNVLVTAVVGVACGQKTFTAIADFVSLQVDWFGRFLDMTKGSPSEDTYRRVFEALDPKVFERCFVLWTQSIAKLYDGEVVALDGKTIRNSTEHPLHLVSAWASDNGLVLGQLATKEKSNEITAFPELIEALMLKGCVITIDAMGCQKKIAQTVIDKSADYLLAVKDNQPTLHREVREYFEAYEDGMLQDERMRVCEEVDKGHGRIETRRCLVTPEVDWYEDKDKWKGLSSL